MEHEAAKNRQQAEASEMKRQLNCLNSLVERGNQALQQKAQVRNTLHLKTGFICVKNAKRNFLTTARNAQKQFYFLFAQDDKFIATLMSELQETQEILNKHKAESNVRCNVYVLKGDDNYRWLYYNLLFPGNTEGAGRAPSFSPAVTGGVSVPAGGVEKSWRSVGSSNTFNGREDPITEGGMTV